MRYSWWRRRSKRCKRCIILLVMVTCILLYEGYSVIKHITCSEQESHKLLEDLCGLYDQGQVAGSFCSYLCHEKRLQYDQCTNYREGKKVIFMNCDKVCEKNENVKVVFKMKSELWERDRLPVSLLRESQDSASHYRQFIIDLIQNSFQESPGVNITQFEYPDPISFAWGWNFERYLANHANMKNASFIGGESVYSLVTQHEYALMKLYSDRIFIPKIYGTCGPGYFVEFTQTLSRYEFGPMSSYLYSWKEQVNLALKLIDLMHVLDTDFHKPLHLCDIKPDNFGLRYKSQINLIDVDCAMFEDKLFDQFRFSNCSSHDDCDFFDCRGHCDKKTNRCLLKRTNNNMQSVCEDVFIGVSTKFPTGLLRDPPPSKKVAVFDALEECAYPAGKKTKHSIRLPASAAAVENLKQVLKNSLIT